MYANQQPRAPHPGGQYPSGWRPPFSGAPPIPQGMNVKPQDWNAGQWQFNPAFKPSANPAHVPWIPGQAWPQPHQQAQAQQQQQQQQQAQVNPFQRPHKPPSEEYLRLPVKANALDLFEMVPRDQLYKGNPDAPHTPWIWNPRGLVEDEEGEGIIEANYRDVYGRTISREPRGATPTRRKSVDQPTSPSPSPLPRHHQRHHSHNPSRQASEPIPSQRQIYAQPAAPVPAPATRRSTEPAPVSHRQQEFDTDEPLRPTFSSSIIRTPDHYRESPSGRRSSMASRSNNEAPPSTSSSSHNQARPTTADADLAGRMEKMNTGSGLKRHSSMPTQGGTVVEEPVSVLSPLILPESSSSGRPLGRHHTHPSLGVIPESSAPSHSGSRSRAPSPKSMSSSPSSHSSSPRRNTPTPHSSASPRGHNPLPTPPREFNYNLSSLASAPVQVQPSPPSPRRVRKGWWNSRGDHLTEEGKVVYAPSDVAHPRELSHYPKQSEGWRNDRGQIIKHEPHWTELEESLPRLGRKPLRPYSSFLIYIDQPAQTSHPRR